MTRMMGAAVLAAALLVGVTSAPARSASLLGCPNLCLTGGLLGLGGRTSVAVSGVQASDAEYRTYSYQWLALDLTEFPPLARTMEIYMEGYGNATTGSWTGSGDAYISDNAGFEFIGGITITDTGLTVTATGSYDGKMFTFAGTAVGGGVASLVDNSDSWECVECES